MCPEGEQLEIFGVLSDDPERPFSVLRMSCAYSYPRPCTLDYRFLKRQVRRSGIPISFRIFHSLFVIHTVKGFGIVNKAEIDVFLELSCFFHDPADVGI